MSTQLFLTFSSLDGQNSEKVEWNVRSTPLADRWLTELTQAIKNRSIMREQRFVGWLTHETALIQLVEKLNESIAIINKFYKSRYHISEQAYLGMHQDTLNALHHHFEILMGQSWNPSHWIKNVPPRVFSAIRLLNDHIHDYESATLAWSNEKAGFQVLRYIQFQMVSFRQMALTDQDLTDFTYACDIGDLVTNYCQLGKTWIEVFHDQDDKIHAENIAPLRYYSSSFIANFYETSTAKSTELTQNVKSFIQSKGGDPNDSKNALGHSVYASLPANSFLRNCSDQDRVDFFRDRLKISEISIKSGAQEVKRKFPNPHSYYAHKASILPLITDPLKYAFGKLFNFGKLS